MPDAQDLQVTRDDMSHRYEVSVDGETAGFIDYIEGDGTLAMTHTEVFEAFRGTAAARTLAGEALADVADRGLAVIPLCPYIARYLTRNEVAGLEVLWPERS
ncbi:GNAT family N-acetyltransferase [Demequina sp. NBRC 110057]|uniref:GNAT family N-acetyltransferase n=1 Tax=Demequina sp. NBRC 110057 TaxID=1570346 RepID=UPI000A02BC6D|nr:GNAT family N-acetyltransferase [Demequina sp. NBRC 110057]